MKNPENIADESADFRDEIDFRLEYDEPAKPTRAGKLSSEQIRAKKAFRLSPELRAYLILEILLTNKTDTAIARKFGVSQPTVSFHRARLAKSLRSRHARILYRKNGTLFFK